MKGKMAFTLLGLAGKTLLGNKSKIKAGLSISKIFINLAGTAMQQKHTRADRKKHYLLPAYMREKSTCVFLEQKESGSSSNTMESVPNDQKAIPSTASDGFSTEIPDNMRQSLREYTWLALSEHMTSFMDGRARIRHDALKEKSAQEILDSQLAASGKFSSIKFNAATGSVLLIYDAAQMNRGEFLDAVLPLGLFLARNIWQPH